MPNHNLRYVLILTVLAYFFFFFGNGLFSLTSPDEVFYTQTAKEMAEQHTWLTPMLFGQPQFEKPVLIYWLLRLSFLLFGMTSYAARFFPALFALIGVITVYFLGKALFKDEKKAFISACVLLSSGFYIGMARSVFTDMVFAVFILLALACFFWAYSSEKRKGLGIVLFFVFCALAVLTKGPLGALIPFAGAMVFLILRKETKFLLCKYTFWGGIIFLALALPWYIFAIAKYGQSFIQEFFYNDHFRRLIQAEHPGNDSWYFYLMTMVGCMMPWSIFVAVSLFYLLRQARGETRAKLFLGAWIIVTFSAFQFAHSKLTSYILPMFPALALVCGDFICEIIAPAQRKKFFILSLLTWLAFLLFLVGLIFATFKYAYFFPSLTANYCQIALVILWLIVLAIYIKKRRPVIILSLVMAFVPIVLSIIPFVYQNIEPYVSSKYACEYLQKNYPPKPSAYLLCSKDFARGARFYSGMKIAVFAPHAENFFSPHPIPFLDTDAKLNEFLKSNSATYGFLKKSALKYFEKMKDRGFEYQVLKNIGNQYLVLIRKR